ncbi:MAG: AAA family ATPase [Actinomycetaceae bacterium]|nr:AAA family ATPase [Actinomycetaceae bacterium]
MSDLIIDSLSRAVEASPNDAPLRGHLIEMLIQAGRTSEAIQQCAFGLQQDATNEQFQALMTRALGGGQASVSQAGASPAIESAPAPTPPQEPSSSAASPSSTDDVLSSFDWQSAEQEVGGPSPAFISSHEDGDDPLKEKMLAHGGDNVSGDELWEVESTGLTLRHVGGMVDVKQRLEVSFLAPLRNPEMRKLYGKSLRGGLLLYGPPGCGKTFIARAVAGEMGASFVNVTLSDVLDQYIGNSEQNIHSIFELARKHAPVVIFFDEVDAIGLKRTQNHSSSWRSVINQLLTELDGIEADNEGIYILAATNAPWDVDPALRRPGRFDRSIAVLPPDEPARVDILRYHLSQRPCEGIDLVKLARSTDGFSGADLAHLCESGAELAMIDSVRTGKVRMISMRDMTTALGQMRPSLGPWFDIARNVVMYADASGEYSDLAAWMRARKLL